MLELRPAAGGAWVPPVLPVVATRGQGVDALLQSISGHRAALESTGERARRERRRAEVQFVALLKERLLQGALDTLAQQKGRLEEVAARIAERQADPYALADELAGQLAS
jgi:LAO/AO transport system kinase